MSKKRIPKPGRKDRHHLLWPQHDWNRGYAKALRNHWYLKMDIPMYTLHRKIHDGVFNIPVPRGNSAKVALHQLSFLERFGALHRYDNIERRLTVLMAIFDCCEPATYAALKKQRDIVQKHYSKNNSR